MSDSHKSVRNATITNMIWRFAERSGAQGIAFVVSLVLARMLDPKDYGIIGLVTVFTTIFQVFIDSGMGSALIQKKDTDDLDYSTVFYFNVVLCVIVYGLLFFAAPLIAWFYEKPELTAVLRVLGITLLISGVKNIQQAYVSKNLIFKKFFFATLAGTVIAAVVGITMAYKGFGVWALVAQQLVNAFIDTVMLWVTVHWRPKRMFSFERLKGLFSFGWKLLLSSLINTIYNDIRQLIIGKIYSSEDLAYYNRGKTIPNYIASNINTSIDSVLLPVMSDAQNDVNRLKTMTRRAIMTSSFILCPVMFGIMAIGKTFILLVLKEKWLPALPFLWIFCFSSVLHPIQTANLNAIKAMGRSDLFLKMEIIKKSFGLLVIFTTMRISVLAMGLSSLVYVLFASVVNSFPNRKLMNYTLPEQLKDIAPSFLLAGVMAVTVYFLPLSVLPMILQMLIQIAVGAAIYVGCAFLFKMESFAFVVKMAKEFVNRK